MWPGSNSTYRDNKPRYLVPYTRAKGWSEKAELFQKNMDRAIEWMKSPDRPANLVMIYFNEPDDTSHSNAPFSEKTNEVVGKVDEQIGVFLNKLKESKMLNKTNLIVLSDHGMATIRHSIDILKISNTELYTVAQVSTAQVGIWPKDGKYKEVLDMFKKLEQTYHFKVFEKNNIPARFHYQ